MAPLLLLLQRTQTQSQNPYGSSQLPITAVLENQVLFSDICRLTHACGTRTYTYNKINKLKKLRWRAVEVWSLLATAHTHAHRRKVATT